MPFSMSNMKGPFFFRFLRSVHPPAVGPVGCDGAGPAVCRSVRPLFLPAVLALTVLFIVSGGCIYPDLKEFPEQERTLFLYNFSNSTFDSDTQVQLNRTLREEIHSKRDFVITDDPDQAVLGLYGEITLYRKEGRLYDNLRNPTRYELIVGARIRMRDRSSGRVLLSTEESASVHYSPREGFPESELQARHRLLRLLARNIHRSMVSAFRGQYDGTQ